MPYSINFGNSQEGWTAVDNSTTPGTTWGYNARWAYIGGTYYGSVMMMMDYASECNDYYVSPGFTLEAGKVYTIESNACMLFNGNGSNLSIGYASSASDMSTFVKLSDITLDDTSQYPAAQKTPFEAPSSGTFYFAFHNTSPRNNSSCFLFEFKLYEGDDSGETPEEVVVEVPYSIDFLNNSENWTSADNNDDGRTWTPSSGFGVMLVMGSHDDDFFSPQVTLEGGVAYKITTNIAIDGAPKDYDVVTLTQGTDKSQMQAIKQLDFEQIGVNVEEIIFTPTSSGNYYFSFHNTSTTGGNTLMIQSFAIDKYVEVMPEENEIYSTRFDESEPLNGWTVIDSNTDGVKWAMEEGYAGPAYNGNMAIGEANDWLITPALNMVAGNDYVIRYTLSQAGAFDADEVVIKWGTTPTAAGMTNSLTTESINLGSGSVDKVIRLTCSQSGNVYIGFNLTTANPNGIISLDKISVSQTSKAKPQPVDGLRVSSNHKEQTVTLNWTNPAFDVTEAPIIETLDITIYENGVKVATLEDRAVGEKDTYTYSPAKFGGMALYRVVASINDIESLPVEASINLDDINGEAILLQDIPLDTADDFAKWVIENKDGGGTWNYSVSAITIPTTSSGDHNDWAITPGVQLEPGKRYVVKFDVATSASFAGNLQVWLGDAQTADNMDTELLSLNNIYYNGFVSTSTPQFSVETAGTYYIGFQAGNIENGMRVRNVNVCYIQEYQEAPVMELPYFENFDKNTEIPTGWRMERSSDELGFYVRDVSQAATINMKAYSRPNALMVKGNAPEAREEVAYTPKFSFEPGNVYTVSFQFNMFQLSGKANNSIAIYKATDQNQESIVGEPVLEVNSQTGMTSWEEKSFDLTVDEAAEYCFVIKVTSDGASDVDIKIDDFSVEEEIYIAPVQPAAIVDVNVTANNSSKSVIFNWNQPVVDVDGNNIPEGSVVKTQIFDGEELIAEPTMTMPNPASVENGKVPVLYTYTYTDDTKYSGQKIYRLIPSIETEVGPATSCVLSISSFTDGYLKERAYVADFTEGDNEWTAIDADEDNNTWAHAESAMTTTGKDEWLISPEVTLTVGKSYYVLCEFKTAYNQSVDITFTRGAGQTVADQTETIYSFNDLIMNKYVVMEIGTNSNAESESYYFGIHVQSENGTQVEIKDFKVMRLMTSNEPEELPYEQDFENRIDINESTLFPNKWGCRTSSSALFRVTTMPENTVAAHSGEYAVVANEYTLGKRDELLYTPYFSLEKGKTYEISYYLYMPGNGENITIGGLYEAYTQDESGIELPLLQAMTEPAKEWTKYLVKYTPKYDMDYCFYFKFLATVANSGIIAIDDFKIEKVSGGSGIAEVEDNGGIYYAQSTSTLYVPENIEQVSIFNMQGQLVLDTENADGTISMANMSKGIYIVKAVNAEGNVISLKVMKN
ncbi:T9SS-dependent choice-of-anchor J family protein [Barnesiella viscericola]|uniref:T9SS type A sorting domain-containing protein n=1 Tax=Barnesiella viscericola TaxID=397865 RepID=A0A921MQF1_9BACT|nr:choice-of-anchor J domain-containing protein [Barnesiella viscericola]HJG88619.1 T9SS type A sorting domain-containing protein [Barnesiella viscericola]